MNQSARKDAGSLRMPTNEEIDAACIEAGKKAAAQLPPHKTIIYHRVQCKAAIELFINLNGLDASPDLAPGRPPAGDTVRADVLAYTAKRLGQLLDKASFSHEADRLAAHECAKELGRVARQQAGEAVAPAHLFDLRFVLNTLEKAVPILKKEAIRGDVQAAINGMRYVIDRTARDAKSKAAQPTEAAPAAEPTDTIPVPRELVAAIEEHWKLEHIPAAIERMQNTIRELRASASPEPLANFSTDQWWFQELDAMASNGTSDQKRAVAVVRHLLKSATIERIRSTGAKAAPADWREPHPPSRNCMCPHCMPSFDERFELPAAPAAGQGEAEELRAIWTECRRVKSTTDGRKHAELHALADWVMAKVDRLRSALATSAPAPQAAPVVPEVKP